MKSDETVGNPKKVINPLLSPQREARLSGVAGIAVLVINASPEIRRVLGE
jgi:hypothetical protein